MESDFDLVINDVSYRVTSPPRERISKVSVLLLFLCLCIYPTQCPLDFTNAINWQEEMERLSDVQNLVMQLYEALHVGEHQLKKERHLIAQLEQLQTQLLPLEQVMERFKRKNLSFLRVTRVVESR